MSILKRLFGKGESLRSNQEPVSITGAQQVNLDGLRRLLIYCFSLAELEDLCFDLAVDFENLPGDGKAAKCASLTTFFASGHHERRLGELIQVCARVRPKAPWDNPGPQYEPYSPSILTELRQMFVKHLTESDLSTLCDSLGLGYLCMPGNAPQHTAVELIMYFARRERVDELIAACAQRWPEVTWPKVLQPSANRPAINSTSAQVTDSILSKNIVQADLTKLRQVLTTHFDKDELRSLCLGLNVDYDTLPSDQEKIDEIIVYFDRQGRIPELIEACARHRPNISW